MATNNTSEGKSLFERYGILGVIEFSETDLISVDYGDGDICARRISENPDDPDYDCANVPFSDGGALRQPNVIAYKTDERNIRWQLGEKASSLIDAADSDVVRTYMNFKRPLTDAAEERYSGDTDKNTPTYREIMQIAFREWFNAIGKNGGFRKGHVIVLVGRPSGGAWKDKEYAYAKLLRDALKGNAYCPRADVVIVSEAQAAMIREMKPKLANRVRKGETAMIVDCGSSTFDMTLVLGNQQIIEESWQFGAGMIEDNMLSYALRSVDPTLTRDDLANNYDKFLLRICKEKFYGPEGMFRNGNGTYNLVFKDKDGQEGSIHPVRINEAFMEHALGSMPVRAGSTAAGSRMERYDSWLDACGAFMRRCRAIADANLPKRAGGNFRLILTGGASVMPEVQKLAHDNIRVKPQRTKKPNYSVAEGLLHVGWLEMRMSQELVKVTGEVRNVLTAYDDKHSLNFTALNLATNGYYDLFKFAVMKWAELNANRTKAQLRTMFDTAYERINWNEILVARLNESFAANRVTENITNIVWNYFHNMFPELPKDFPFKIDSNIITPIVNGIYEKPYIPFSVLIGPINNFFAGGDDDDKKVTDYRSLTILDGVIKKEDRRKSEIRSSYRANNSGIKDFNERFIERFLLEMQQPLRVHIQKMTTYFMHAT